MIAHSVERIVRIEEHDGRAMRVMGAAALGLAQRSEYSEICRHRNTLRQQLAVTCACCQPDSAVLGE